jgi:hypothetical protein
MPASAARSCTRKSSDAKTGSKSGIDRASSGLGETCSSRGAHAIQAMSVRRGFFGSVFT